jgi:hypothetical protein
MSLRPKNGDTETPRPIERIKLHMHDLELMNSWVKQQYVVL